MNKISVCDEIQMKNPTFNNPKFDDNTTKNLMNDFNKLINENFNLNEFSDLKMSSISSISATQLEHISNEIFNKFNHYKQLLNFKEEVNNEFQINCQVFLKQMEKMILSIFKYNDTSLVKNSIIRIESLINQNNEKFKELKGTLSTFEKGNDAYFTHSNEKKLKVKEYVTFLKTLLSLFTFLEDNFTFDLDEEKRNLYRLNTFLQVLSDFSIKLHENSNQEFLESFNVEKIFKNEEINDNIRNLNNNNFPQDIEIMTKDSKMINTSPNSNIIECNENIKDKVRKIYQQNFFQFYFVKEDGIYLRNHASKCERLGCSRNYKYYEIKLKLNNDENSNDINSYITSIISLFTKYIIAYKEKDKLSEKDQFTKIIISGEGQPKNMMKRSLKKIVKEVKKDYLIKVTIYNSLARCLNDTHLKILDSSKDSYSFYTNL